jgi:hypothetical protein
LAGPPRTVACEARRVFTQKKVRIWAIFTLSRTVATKIAPERPCRAVSAYAPRSQSRQTLYASLTRTHRLDIVIAVVAPSFPAPPSAPLLVLPAIEPRAVAAAAALACQQRLRCIALLRAAHGVGRCGVEWGAHSAARHSTAQHSTPGLCASSGCGVRHAPAPHAGLGLSGALGSCEQHTGVWTKGCGSGVGAHTHTPGVNQLIGSATQPIGSATHTLRCPQALHICLCSCLLFST